MTLRHSSLSIRILALFFLAAATVHCSPKGSEPAPGADQALESASRALESASSPPKRGNIAAKIPHPCDVFTLADVRSIFGATAESVKTERGEVPGNYTCSYEWKKADWEAVKERNDAGYMKVISGRGGPGGVKAYLATLEPEDAKVFITFHGGDFKTEAQAVQSLDGLIEGFRKGMGTKDFMVQAEFDPSEGVASKAAWSDKLRQLSTVSGTTLYHVRVERNGDRSLDRVDAETIAHRIHAAL